MTRTGKSPRLGGHIDEPFVELCPADADRLVLTEGGLARLTSAHGSAVLRVRVSDGQRPGEVFAPIHWNGETASDARLGALVHPARDPHSGQPDMKRRRSLSRRCGSPLMVLFCLARRSRFPMISGGRAHPFTAAR
ncbi:molybdopterin dinucleotide binding domain-containing protein [Methyloceanibacter superfactus]|uniref:molybdopterin dinucleotide binding domain-containing protein n=1 Tax=Methyloceanibacter superfactus TaxID=1774969 RepID=UPI000A7BF829|nr:molybdopterin dinucleotide binding domain-containing protein [Methyloceanibacter superfactus]